ncbi:hypothetical protein CUJ89_21355 [Burkholderia pyrrocinia]|uniref:Uncharacterized protein n=2 Tax=Burkholderia pyrrocinia TaxID=60550 RepID=A0A2Z5N272_BURPY|nr:hypothetical protein CUJ89_21355 [Burkholderia pyrrocinia]
MRRRMSRGTVLHQQLPRQHLARLGIDPAAVDYVLGFRTSMFTLTVVLLACIALSTALGPLHRRRRAGA